jgi:hypothetical protein
MGSHEGMVDLCSERSFAMTQRIVRQYTGQGKLVFDNNDSAEINYQLDEFQEFIPDGAGGELASFKSMRGRVSHVKGHPAWHSVILLNPGPFTLEMTDGRKIKVLFEDAGGSIKTTGGFF